MKKSVILTVAALTLTFTACDDFLERYPEGGTIRQDQYEKLDNQLEGSVRGLYSKLYTMGGSKHDEFGKRSIDLWGDILCSDIAVTGKTYGWLYTDEQMLTINRSGTIWSHYYSQLHNINTTIYGAHQTDFGKKFVKTNADGVVTGYNWPSTSDIEYNELDYDNAMYYAQVLGLRGYIYAQLAKLYTPVMESNKFLASGIGDFDCVPIYTELNSASPQPLSTTAAVYNYAFNDLETSVKIFEEFDQDFETSFTRDSKLVLNRDVVAGILAMAYLNECVYLDDKSAEFTKHATNALTNAEKVINTNKYPILKDAELLTNGFNSVNNAGWIWGQEVTIETSGGLKSWFGQVDIHSYSYAWAGDTKVIDAELRDQMHNWDKRRLWFNDGKANSVYADCPDKKFFSALSPNSTDADDIDRDWLSDNVFMRIESMYLIAAEAAWRLADYTKAEGYLKQITDERVNKDAFMWETEYNNYITNLTGNKDAIKEALIYNWRVEMWGEGYGWETFKRFGEARKRGNNHDYAAGVAIEPKDDKFNMNIPDFESTYNPNLRDSEK